MAFLEDHILYKFDQDPPRRPSKTRSPISAMHAQFPIIKREFSNLQWDAKSKCYSIINIVRHLENKLLIRLQK